MPREHPGASYGELGGVLGRVEDHGGNRLHRLAIPLRMRNLVSEDLNHMGALP